MATTIYLYLKTHNITGLKYIGKTIKDPLIYKGSGKYWLNHIKVHGNDVKTEILFQTSDKKEFARIALEYSRKWNIVESNKFANLKEENGDGGSASGKNAIWYGKKRSEETKKKISIANTGQKNGFFGKTHSIDTKIKISSILQNARKGENNPRARKIMVDGIIFNTLLDCAKAYGWKTNKNVINRLKNEKYTNWYYINQKEI